MSALARPKQDIVLSVKDLVSGLYLRAAREAACITIITMAVVVIIMMMMTTTQYVLAANACAGIR